MTHTLPHQQLYTLREAAHLLGWGERKLFRQLRDIGALDATNVPPARYVQDGYFKIELRSYWHREHKKYIAYAKALLTVKGLGWVNEKINTGIQMAERGD